MSQNTLTPRIVADRGNESIFFGKAVAAVVNGGDTKEVAEEFGGKVKLRANSTLAGKPRDTIFASKLSKFLGYGADVANHVPMLKETQVAARKVFGSMVKEASSSGSGRRDYAAEKVQNEKILAELLAGINLED